MTPGERINELCGRRWKELLGTAGDELRQENEVEIYKERLKEIEIAFRYNLGLISDRDSELDVLEEHLRSVIAELERLTQEKAVCEELLERLDNEKRNEIKILKDELLSREKLLRDLQRKSEGNDFALKEKIENIRSGVRAKFEREKMKLENKYLTVLERLKAEHEKGMNMLSRKYEKQIDEVVIPALVQIKKEKDDLGSVLAENKLLKKCLNHFGRANVDRDEMGRKCCVGQCEELSKIYERMKEDMEDIISRIEKKALIDKETVTSLETGEASTQTAVEESAKNYDMIVEQNKVLKEVIKNLKRDKVKQESEMSKRFENEISDLRKELEMEKLKRSEEEAIIYNLEASVVCLKEKLVSSLSRNGKDISDKNMRASEVDAYSGRRKSIREKKISR